MQLSRLVVGYVRLSCLRICNYRRYVGALAIMLRAHCDFMLLCFPTYPSVESFCLFVIKGLVYELV